MIPTRGLMWAVLRERLPLLCAVVAAALVFALLMYGCGSVEAPCDMDECNLECLESDRGDYALGSCVEDRCRCVPAWRGDGGPDGGDVDVDTDVDSDADTDGDADTDSDTDAPCGYGTDDLDCDGDVDPLCRGPKSPFPGEGDPWGMPRFHATFEGGADCAGAGVERIRVWTVGYSDVYEGGGPQCNAGDPQTTFEWEPGHISPGCYRFDLIGENNFGVGVWVGIAFVDLDDYETDDTPVVLRPCDGDCPY